MKASGIRAELIAEMASGLTNEELGGAFRLLSRIISSEKPIPADRAHLIAQMDAASWASSMGGVLEFFCVLDDGSISHELLEARALPACAGRAAPGPTSTVAATIISPTRRPVSAFKVPGYARSEKPVVTSIKKAIFDNGVALIERSGKSSAVARAIVNNLLNQWQEGDVASVFASASKRPDLASPHEWIVKTLQKTGTPRLSGRPFASRDQSPAPRPAQDRAMATPDLLGVSSLTAAHIRKQNAGLKFKFAKPSAKQEAI
jgi:hypothetical protein